jgi:hypothetical protein
VRFVSFMTSISVRALAVVLCMYAFYHVWMAFSERH